MSSDTALGPFETIEVERHDRVLLIRLNRPKALNALNAVMMEEVTGVMRRFDRDPEIGCFLLTGAGDKAFAAGADIKFMAPHSYMEAYNSDMLSGWDQVAACRTPKIAAVGGYALGGGCELAMMCDMIFASTAAQFGQPEIKLGVMPGLGGSQRLTKLIGKSKAMDLILTGRMMGAEEAERAGLAARVVEPDALQDEAMQAAQTIASFSKPIACLARDAVNRAEETSLTEGLLFERRVFHSMFATSDQKEGMGAFIEKRKPEFKGE
jgi:enoyl-CoA hydratase